MTEKEIIEIKKEFQELKKLMQLSKTTLNMDEAVLLTGLSKGYLYRLVASRKIPHWKSKGGKLTFFSKSELLNWLLHSKVLTEEETASEAANYCVSGKIDDGVHREALAMQEATQGLTNKKRRAKV